MTKIKPILTRDRRDVNRLVKTVAALEFFIKKNNSIERRWWFPHKKRCSDQERNLSMMKR